MPLSMGKLLSSVSQEFPFNSSIVKLMAVPKFSIIIMFTSPSPLCCRWTIALCHAYGRQWCMNRYHRSFFIYLFIFFYCQEVLYACSQRCLDVSIDKPLWYHQFFFLYIITGKRNYFPTSTPLDTNCRQYRI